MSSSRARRREISAGGVVLRGEPGRERTVVIVPTRRAGDGSRVLALPKGHVDPGESPIEAAAREVREETGIVVVAEPLCKLGETRYFYRRDGRTVGKTVSFFLFSYSSGDTADHDDEVLEARWIDLRAASAELSYEGERNMVALALAHLDKAPLAPKDR
jgi:8-oxo-dGTP pyrophosphatase MutT (NUDIX family)